MIVIKKLECLSFVCVCTVASAFIVEPAEAFNFEISGQINRAVIAADNGEKSDAKSVDNSGSPSRIAITGEEEMSNGLTLGFNYELGIFTAPSIEFDIRDYERHGSTFDTRYSQAYIEGKFGRLTLGKGSAASDNTSNVDLSGTLNQGGGGSLTSYSSGISFLDEDSDVIGTIGDSYNRFNGLGRTNNIRYDTPSLDGLVLSTSLSEGAAYDLTARYDKEFSDGSEFAIAADWLDSRDRDSRINEDGTRINLERFQEYGGSASFLLPSGLNFTAIYKRRQFKHPLPDGKSDTAQNYFAGVGYIAARHHFQVGWGQTEDLLNDGSTASQYGLAYKYEWSDSVDLYAGYHLVKLDGARDSTMGESVRAQNINFVFTGVLIKFDEIGSLLNNKLSK